MPFTLTEAPSDVLSTETGDSSNRWTLNFGPQHPATHTTLRLVLELDGPYLIKLAEMGTGSAQVHVIVQMVAADAAAFARDAAKPEPAEWALPYATPSLPLDDACDCERGRPAEISAMSFHLPEHE